jgi:nitroimidazol reductase NimA-like FMN-containing flavoprotein (pyridoxamine 5'-phosphate oxidase superfamily)
MPGKSKNLTRQQTEHFLKENQYGILSFAGETPYALPMGYFYKRKTILVGLTTTGKKTEYLKNSTRICFTISKPRWLVPELKVPCTSVVVEGTLVEVSNRSYYGIKSPPSADLQLYRIKVSSMGARKCNRKPCELFAEKKK